MDFSRHIKFIDIDCQSHSQRLRYFDWGEGMPLLYLHGWGCDHSIFYPLIENLSDQGRHIAIDFPGFGESPRPEAVWGTEEYGDLVYRLIKQYRLEKPMLIGHSFGARAALRLARKHPDVLRGMVLIGAAGLKRDVPFRRKIRVKTIRAAARLAQRLLPGSMGIKLKDSLYQRIASRDYLNAGEMRSIFVKVVNEDLASLLPGIQIPTLLIYGENDEETPPSIGKKMNALLPNSRCIELPEFDHFSILDRGRHQTGHQMRGFLKEIQE
ncbi:MAG: alpha/beta hydrolase [Candidatus Omnitrophota bacterium]